jgi:ketosteroid isomerase-like protein
MNLIYFRSLALALLLGFAGAQPAAALDHDSTAIVATIDRFHTALETADSAAVKRLLSDDVTVLESGSLETRAEYLRHHLGADIEFAQAIHSVRKLVSVTRSGNTAWVVSTSTTQGSFKGRAINSDGAELMVLTRRKTGWQIRAIHWSSARRQPAK